MKQYTHDELTEQFPLIFQKYKYIECGEGWYSLLYDLFVIIEDHIKHLPEELQADLYLVQCKQKFGSLRVYMEQSTPFINGAISLAEYMSYHICEVCGMPGTRRSGGWIETLCDTCFNAKPKKKEEEDV